MQLVPFIYAVIYLLALSMYFVGSESLSKWMDTLFYMPPIMICFLLVLSKMFRLCKWHRRACLIPLIPQVIGLFDYYVIELSVSEAVLNVAVIILSVLLFLLSAYKVFFANGLHN